MCKSKFEELFLQIYTHRFSFLILNHKDIRNAWENLKDSIHAHVGIKSKDKRVLNSIASLNELMRSIIYFFERYEEDCRRVRVGDEEYYRRRIEELGCCSNCSDCNQKEFK